jgi:hypothetical protein
VGKLSPHTINCYKSRLKRLRKVLPLMPDDDPEKPLVVKQIEKLTNQLGKEMTDLEIALARGPGRPRSQPIVREYGEAAKEGPTAEELLAAHNDKIARLRAQVLKDNPELANLERERKEEEESNKQLQEMIKLANDQLGGDTNEGPGKATDPVGPVKGTD